VKENARRGVGELIGNERGECDGPSGRKKWGADEDVRRMSRNADKHESLAE
jgi:hypothetical protein